MTEQTLTTAHDLGRRLEHLARTHSCVHLPGTPAYAAAVAPWNLAVPVHPVAVVEARCAEDVVTAVRFARGAGIQVAVQATGHGAAADLDGVLLVSTRRLTALFVHAHERWARAEAGVTWGQVLEAGAPHGLAGLCGSSPGVGVVGYTTGGGVGPLARTHGLASDRVRAFEVVTGDGHLVRATATEHPDLFWALRGGKGLAGIVTAVEFDLLPIAEIYGGAVYFDGADAPEVLRRWTAWSATLPATATTSVALLRLPPLPAVPPPLAGRLTVAVRFAWTGTPEGGAAVIDRIRSVATPIVDTVAVMPYAALGAIHSDPVDPMPARDHHATLTELPREAVDRLLALAGPGADSPQVVVEVRQLGGALGSGPECAYPARGAAYSLTTIGLGVPPVIDAVDAHAGAVLEAVRPWSDGGLPNFAARSGAAWLTATYDAGRLRHLSRVSRAHDRDRTIFGTRTLDRAAGR